MIVVYMHCTAQGTDRLAKASRLQRDFEREVTNPKCTCPMFILPDGKALGKTSDKTEHAAQLEGQLKATAKEKKRISAQCKEEERRRLHEHSAMPLNKGMLKVVSSNLANGFTHLAVNLQLRINIAAKIVLAVNTFSKQKRS
jgi:hypothetical protein